MEIPMRDKLIITTRKKTTEQIFQTLEVVMSAHPRDASFELDLISYLLAYRLRDAESIDRLHGLIDQHER
jgi:hypothetical protein